MVSQGSVENVFPVGKALGYRDLLARKSTISGQLLASVSSFYANLAILSRNNQSGRPAASLIKEPVASSHSCINPVPGAAPIVITRSRRGAFGKLQQPARLYDRLLVDLRFSLPNPAACSRAHLTTEHLLQVKVSELLQDEGPAFGGCPREEQGGFVSEDSVVTGGELRSRNWKCALDLKQKDFFLFGNLE
uniref:Uncharacterized protein n=1 Tax=Steinernema glaseri TaxID=37863 RepID=A0A1I7ZUA6_9BILA